MKLAVYLAQADLTDRAFAKRLGVSTAFVHRLKAGRRLPSLSVLRRITDLTRGNVRAEDFDQASR